MIEQTTPPREVVDYPEADGEPLADNTLQFEWIATIKGNLDAVFAGDPDVFVAGDLLWYPVEGDNTTRVAPDTLVAFGRPKGYRGSYRQWDEGGVAPQVVFEILSPGNRPGAMREKFDFYRHFGVLEYYVYDPDDGTLRRWRRGEPGLMTDVPAGTSYTSPLLGVRFEPQPDGGQMLVYRPDGRLFLTFGQLSQERDAQQQRADAERQRADVAQQRADAEQSRADAERQRADSAEERLRRYEERLRQLGIDPAE